MSYEIILTEENEAFRLCHVTSTVFKTRKVWRIQFHDGKEAMLYKCSDKWMQYNVEWLDTFTLIAVGKCIDGAAGRENLPDDYFYDMLIN